MSRVHTSTPANTMTPIGPYSHIAKCGEFITIGGTAGVNPATGKLAGPDIKSQTTQILEAFEVMLASAGSDLKHVLHINVFLADIKDFAEMNAAYAAPIMAGFTTRRANALNVRWRPAPRLKSTAS